MFHVNEFSTFPCMAKDFAGGSVVKNLPASAGDPWIREIPWRRKQQPTAVFLPGEFHAQRSLADYSPWGLNRVGHNLVAKQQQSLKN